MHVDTINLDGESSLKEKYALYKEVNVSDYDKENQEDVKISKIFQNLNGTT